MSRPSIQSLHNSEEYSFVESFTIDEMPQFLAREAGFKTQPAMADQPAKRVASKWIVIGILLILGGVVGSLMGSLAKSDAPEPLLHLGWQLVIGVVGLFLIVLPIHEIIHALFFKLLGAKNVGFGYSKKGLMVYAYAQRFVMTLRENALVAAMPFLLITLLISVCWVLVPGLKVIWIVILLFHTLGCMGDFILILHAWKNRKEAMYTYDDLSEKRTYFFERH